MSTDRPKMVAYITESLRAYLEPLVGPPTIDIAVEAMSKTFGRPVTPIAVCGGVLRVSVPLTPEELAGMAALRYADGASHENVTAWLEESTAGFRNVLCEVVDEHGTKMWMLRPVTWAHATGGPTVEQSAEIRTAASAGHEPSRLLLRALGGEREPWDAYVNQRLAEIETEDQGAQNTAVDGTPDIATGPTCTGVAGEASAPSDTDPV